MGSWWTIWKFSGDLSWNSPPGMGPRSVISDDIWKINMQYQSQMSKIRLTQVTRHFSVHYRCSEANCFLAVNVFSTVLVVSQSYCCVIYKISMPFWSFVPHQNKYASVLSHGSWCLFLCFPLCHGVVFWVVAWPCIFICTRHVIQLKIDNQLFR